jgi:hypothetical protein
VKEMLAIRNLAVGALNAPLLRRFYSFKKLLNPLPGSNTFFNKMK